MENISCETNFGLSKCFRNCVQPRFCGNNNNIEYYHKTADCDIQFLYNSSTNKMLITCISDHIWSDSLYIFFSAKGSKTSQSINLCVSLIKQHTDLKAGLDHCVQMERSSESHFVITPLQCHSRFYISGPLDVQL